MREIIAVCRSTKKERDRVARVLDRYFWRIGGRTWRGKATNACLDRVSRELRVKARRNTAVVIHEIRSAHESRVPIVRIGAKRAFSESGLVPVSTNPSQTQLNHRLSNNKAVVGIAALFHDLGKATKLFQEKLRCALQGGEPKADMVRHELHSAAVWDNLFGQVANADLPAVIAELTSERIDESCNQVRDMLTRLAACPDDKLPFKFVAREGSLAHAIGMLILLHHRLPEGDSDLLTPIAKRHVRPLESSEDRPDLSIAAGKPFWHEDWWLTALRRDANALMPDAPLIGLDVFLRAALMMGDHLGSHQKKIPDEFPEHLANTKRDDETGKICPGDSLSKHLRRVHAAVRQGVDLFERYADRFPALDESAMPVDIAYPVSSDDMRFRWQGDAAKAARKLCSENEGGFFACIMAGTGTGKTRGAPTLLAGAALGDARPERRCLRMSLGLGLRVLATQSADEYVSDLGFNHQDVAVLVGQAPLKFSQGDDQIEDDNSGSESLIKIPDWLKVELTTGGVPEVGGEGEADWLRTLSLDTSRGLPAFCEKVLEAAGARVSNGRLLLQTPIMVGTVDHLMGVASPINSRFLLQSVRVATSDLILDEIDQFDGEDLAAIGRLVYQTAVAGRRVIIMSATLTDDIALSLHAAYQEGWACFAKSQGIADHVNLLVTGDAPGSCRTNAQGESFQEIFASCCTKTLQALGKAPAARRAEILPPCDSWQDLLAQVDESCHRLHDTNNAKIGDFFVSFGMIRMTRIAHTAALAAQLQSGPIAGRLRLVVCLHSQFPRLHRAWIETRLKRALTRKSSNPDAGLEQLCRDEMLFEHALAVGTKSIEIVLVSSPVIETGNDLDFDWAILDPISTRSVIQAAGRVCRHRQVSGQQPNILILGRSPIAIQHGKLALPGVETAPHQDAKIARQSLDKFELRLFRELAGDFDFSIINATQILDHSKDFPLRDAETKLRREYLSIESDKPLGKFIKHPNARMVQNMARVRKFRRSTTRKILFTQIGENFSDDCWHRDLAPGTRQSNLQPVDSDAFKHCVVEGCHLFRNYTDSAWNALAPGQEPNSDDIERLMQVEVPDYGDDPDVNVAYTEFSGFTRGTAEDLFTPFGKSQ